MDYLVDIYLAQPFWVWLAVAVILAIGAALATEWLLWPAVSAVVVAILAAMGLTNSLLVELAVFSILTLAVTITSRRLVKRVNPPEPDINARDDRLIGRPAQVVADFDRGRGRVFVSGTEWTATLAEGQAVPQIGETVIVQAFDGGVLTVRAKS